MIVAASYLLLISLGAVGGVGAAGLQRPPAALPGAGGPGRAVSGAAAAHAPANLPIEGQRRRDLEDLQRQAVAATLAHMKVMVDWREHKLAELVDWRDRVEVASLIHREQGLYLDWRGLTLPELNDIRLRASKSAELAASYGVSVDWRLYTWRQLEEIRRAVARIQTSSESAASAEARLRKARAAGATTASATAPPLPRMRSREVDPITDL